MNQRIRVRGSTSLWIVSLTLLALLGLGTQPTLSTYSSATVTNSPNSNQLGHLAFDAELPSGPQLLCSVKGAQASTCRGDIFPTSPATSTDTTLTAHFTNRSNLGTLGMVQQVRMVKCSPTQFANSATTSNPLLPRGRVTRQVSDPWATTSAARFSGEQFAGGVQAFNSSGLASGSYTVGAWFKLPTSSGGGPLLSIGSLPHNSTYGSLAANPALYLGPLGQPRFAATRSGGQFFLEGTGNFRDDKWHFLTVTVMRGVSNTSVTMYVDGTVVASQPSAPLFTGTPWNYFLKVGWMDWPGMSGNSVNLNGSVSGIFIAQGAASAAEVTAMNSATSAAAYAASVPRAMNLWMFGDAPTSTYDGTVPWLEPDREPCSHIMVSWAIDGITAMPLATAAVQETSGWQPANGVPTQWPGTPSTSTTVLRRNSPYDIELANVEFLTVVEYRYLLGSNWSTVLTFDRMLVLA